MTFFLAISARSCAPFQFFTVQDLVRGECDVWYFTNMILLLFRFFLSPPSCGGAVGRVPSVGDLYPTDNSNYSVCASVDTLVANIIFLCTTSIHLCCALFPLVLWVPVLSS